MREGGPHQTPVAMSVQSQQHVAELVRENPSQRSRIDPVIDTWRFPTVPVPIDGARHVLRPEGNATCSQLSTAEPVIVAVSATAMHFEVGRPRLHEHGHERTVRVIVRREVETQHDTPRLEHPLGLVEGGRKDLVAELRAAVDMNVQGQRRRRESREQESERRHARMLPGACVGRPACSRPVSSTLRRGVALEEIEMRRCICFWILTIVGPVATVLAINAVTGDEVWTLEVNGTQYVAVIAEHPWLPSTPVSAISLASRHHSSPR